MSNTINIVQPKAEDGVTEVSFVTRTNSIFKSDGSPLGDSLDEYMDEMDELSQDITDLKTINYDYNNARFIGVFVSGSGVNVIIPTASLAINPQASNLSIYHNNSWLSLTVSSVTARDNGIAITGTTTTSLTHGASYLARCSVTATLT